MSTTLKSTLLDRVPSYQKVVGHWQRGTKLEEAQQEFGDYESDIVEVIPCLVPYRSDHQR